MPTYNVTIFFLPPNPNLTGRLDTDTQPPTFTICKFTTEVMVQPGGVLVITVPDACPPRPGRYTLIPSGLDGWGPLIITGTYVTGDPQTGTWTAEAEGA